MPAQPKENPKENALFNLVDGLDNITTQCFECRNIPFSNHKSYIVNTATRTKIMVFCSKHLNRAICTIASFEDVTRQTTSAIINNVTPASKHPSPIYIYNMPIVVDGKKIKVLIATDKDIHTITRDGKAVAHRLKEASPTQGKEPQEAQDPEDISLTLSSADVLKRTEGNILRLSDSEKATLFRSGLEKMDMAIQALELDHKHMKSALCGLYSEKMDESVRGRAMQLNASVHATVELLEKNAKRREEAAIKAQQRGEEGGQCENEADIVDGDVIPFIREHFGDTLEPDQVDTMRAWLKSL